MGYLTIMGYFQQRRVHISFCDRDASATSTLVYFNPQRPIKTSVRCGRPYVARTKEGCGNPALPVGADAGIAEAAVLGWVSVIILCRP
jgi:hypothetical protein